MRDHDEPTVRAVFVTEVHRLVDDLLELEPRVRLGDAGAVHRTRITCRRLRATLRTYRPVATDERAETLRQELRWLGLQLGGARDSEVLGRRLDELVAAEPDDIAVALTALAHAELSTGHEVGLASAVAALDSHRWTAILALLRAVDDFAMDESLADAPAADELPALVKRPVKRLRAAVRAWREDEGDDVALHEVRKRAKDLRYTAELAAPVLGKRLDAVAEGAKRVQESLGVHQDSVVMRRFLRHLAQDGTDDRFVLGRIDAAEERRWLESRDEFVEAWKRLRHDLRRL